METKHNALAAALLNIAAGKKTATTDAAMAQPEEKFAAETIAALDDNFSPRQIDAVVEFAEHAIDYASKRVALVTYVRAIHPKFPSWAAFKAAGMAIEGIGGEYCRKLYRGAVMDAFGKLPNAGKSRKGGDKSAMSPKRWIRTVDTGIAGLLERIDKVPRHDVNAAVLRDFIAAVRQVQNMAKVLRKAVNE